MATEMTFKEKVRYIFRKYRNTPKDRYEAYWKIFITFYAKDLGKFSLNYIKPSVMKFFKDWASIERAIRYILEEEEFELPPELDAKRQKLSADFRSKYKKNESNNNPQSRQIPAL